MKASTENTCNYMIEYQSKSTIYSQTMKRELAAEKNRLLATGGLK